MPLREPGNFSVIGRLLEEISWEGRRVKGYRFGGRGLENVLTAEVLLPLDYLPREHFLGQVVKAAHGADAARTYLVDEVEGVRLTVLPDETRLGQAGLVVQPDALLESTRVHVLVEAKGMLQSVFRPEQLAREYLALMQNAGNRVPMLLLLLGSQPPIVVKNSGRLGLVEAVRSNLRSVHSRLHMELDVESLEDMVPEWIAWITWAEVSQIVATQAELFPTQHASFGGTVQRLSRSVTDAIR